MGNPLQRKPKDPGGTANPRCQAAAPRPGQIPSGLQMADPVGRERLPAPGEPPRILAAPQGTGHLVAGLFRPRILCISKILRRPTSTWSRLISSAIRFLAEKPVARVENGAHDGSQYWKNKERVTFDAAYGVVPTLFPYVFNFSAGVSGIL